MVAVKGATAYRKGEYFRDQVTVNNSRGPVWEGITVSATGQSSVTGNEFVPKTPEVYGYDLDGNLTSDGRWTYTWDGENRLVEMTSLSGAPAGSKLKLDFTYDYQGRRIQKVVSAWNGSAYVAQSTSRFIYDGWNLIAELDGAYTVLRRYVWGADLSGTMQGAGGVGGLLEVEDPVNGTNFVAYDGNGKVMTLASANDGSSSAVYEYGPFGEVIRATGLMAQVNVFGFSTKYRDGESGLVYYGYRYYSASLGRWCSRDPLHEQGGLNLYCALGCDAVDRIDYLGRTTYTDPAPTGIDPCEWLGWIRAVDPGGKVAGKEAWTDFEEAPAPDVGPQRRCGCGVYYLINNCKCSVTVWVNPDFDGSILSLTQTTDLIHHEFMHAQIDAESFRFKINVVKSLGGICVPQQCDDFRLDAIKHFEEAGDDIRSYKNALWHVQDYPVGEQQYWRGYANMLWGYVTRDLQEASEDLGNLAKCVGHSVAGAFSF